MSGPPAPVARLEHFRQAKSVPELRGMPPVPRDRTRLYSVESYAAQYGLTLERATELRDSCSTHPEMERLIHREIGRDPALKDRILNPDGVLPPTEEELEEAERVLERARVGGFGGLVGSP